MTSRPAAVLLLALLGTVAFPAAGAAQEHKFWFHLSGGGGMASASCNDCDSGWHGGASADGRFGVSLGRHFVVGPEFNVWSREFNPGELTTLMSVTGTVLFYPRGTGFFVKGGAGVAMVNLEETLQGATLTANLGSGPGAIAGIGFDTPVGKRGRWALTMGVDYWYGRMGDLTFVGDLVAADSRHTVVDFTIGFTFH